MTYYSITTPKDYESIGNVFPQAWHIYTPDLIVKSIKAGDLHYFLAHESMKNIYREKAPDDITWEFMLDRKTFFSDVLSGADDLLISIRLFDLLRDFNTDHVDFVKCLIHSKKEDKKYYCLYVREGIMDKYIDITATTFVLLDTTDENFRLEYKVKNMQHYQQRMTNVRFRWLTVKDGLFFKDYLPTEDIIKLEQFKQKLYVSERLYQALLESKMTGFEFGDPITIHKT